MSDADTHVESTPESMPVCVHARKPRKPGPSRATSARKYLLMLDPEQIERVDQCKWDSRVGSRSEMVRMLIEKALKMKGYGQ